MEHYAKCPQCASAIEVERVHNGVMYVWHGFCDVCRWAQAYFADEDVKESP